MLNHISIGVRDLGRATTFYDAALAPLGYVRVHDGADAVGYGSGGSAVLWLLQTASPVPADPKSGLHVCFDGPSRKAVDAFHAAALQHGGKDNGKPGVRADYGPNYYAAFVVDPDGYRIEAYCGLPA